MAFELFKSNRKGQSNVWAVISVVFGIGVIGVIAYMMFFMSSEFRNQLDTTSLTENQTEILHDIDESQQDGFSLVTILIIMLVFSVALLLIMGIMRLFSR